MYPLTREESIIEEIVDEQFEDKPGWTDVTDFMSKNCTVNYILARVL